MMFEEYDLSSLSFPGFEFEWAQVTDSLTRSAPGRLWAESRDFRVGEAMKKEGLKAEHPVILIPGIVSTGLESWTTSPEYRAYFRKRLWGATTMVRAVLADHERWIAALMLDPETGLDAASTFMPGYWIWSKIIENLAVLNYDTNNLDLAAYDWRLSCYSLEVRDGYFSRLKYQVESFKKRQGKKVVLVSHSMGGTVVMYLCAHILKFHNEFQGPRDVHCRLIQVILGHGFFGEYYDPFVPSEDPNCPCGSVTMQTLCHVLLDCPLLNEARMSLRMASKPLRVADLFGIDTGLRAMVTFLSASRTSRK